MQRVFRLVAALVLLTAGSFADEASRRAKAEQMMALSNTERSLQQGMQQMMEQLKGSYITDMLGVKIPDEAKPKLEEFQRRISEVIMDTFRWERVKPDFVQLYAEMFTEEELDGIIAFLQTPAGRSMMDKNPILMQRSMAISKRLMMQAQPRIQELMREVLQPAPAPKEK